MNKIDSSRILKVEGGYNFRDLGGLITTEGKTIKKSLLFRTDELSALQPDDLALLAGYDVRTVVDFRTNEEREKSVDRIPVTCKNEVHLDILAANMDTFVAEIQKGTTNFKKILIDFYRELVLGQNAIDQFVKFFEILQNPVDTAVIYHCTAGKDRTGIATALILKALAVDWKEIESDYLLSNEFLKNKYASYLAQNPKYADLFLVQSDYLKSAMDAIHEKYGSVEHYLTTVLKVDIDLMKDIYTEE